VLLLEADVDPLLKAHKAFLSSWGREYPLHSAAIRGQRRAFSWLRTQPERAAAFLADLLKLLLSLPVHGIACVIDRPGYVARYSGLYAGQPWLMCKTAFAILVERAAKHARRLDAQLGIKYSCFDGKR